MPAPAASALVDVVDDRDEPIGVLERGRVLGEGANFRTVHVLLVDDASTKFVAVFRGQITGEQPRICERGQIERLRWVGLQDLDTELSQEPERFTPTFRHVLAFWSSHD